MTKGRQSKAEIVAETLKGVEQVIEAVVASGDSSKNSEERKYQFTKHAHFRMAHSFYLRELRELFKDQTDVDLSAVEYAILSLEQRDGKRAEVEADVDGLPAGSLVKCELELDRNCAREFLPKRWIAKSGKPTGSYTPDLADAEIAVCHNCQQMICEDIRVYNAKVSEKEQKLFPRFLQKADAEDAVARRQKAIDGQRAREGKLGTLRDKLQVVADLKRRYGR